MTRYLAVAGLLLAFFVHPLTHGLDHVSHDSPAHSVSQDGDCPLCLAFVQPFVPLQLSVPQDWSRVSFPCLAVSLDADTPLAFQGRAPPRSA